MSSDWAIGPINIALTVLLDKLAPTTTIIIHKFFVDVQIHNIFHKLIQFHLYKFYAKKKKKRKKVLVVLGFVKFQFSIISLVNFCNYSLFFLNLKYMLDIKGI